MRLLLDSHVLIWLLYGPHRVQGIRSVVESAGFVGVSLVSVWELTIKFSQGRLPVSPRELLRGIEELGLQTVTLKPEHLLRLPEIKLPHGDPFDRLLLAQALAENCEFVTADSQLLKSEYRTLAV